MEIVRIVNVSMFFEYLFHVTFIYIIYIYCNITGVRKEYGLSPLLFNWVSNEEMGKSTDTSKIVETDNIEYQLNNFREQMLYVNT